MDEQSLNELLECSVCLESLDATSRVLPCQHTFCKRCLDEIVCTKNELRCPECRTLVEICVDELPLNILLIRLLEGMKNARVGLGVLEAASTASDPSSPTNSKGSGSPEGCASKPASPYKALTIGQPCAKALYSYEAKEPGDLSFKKGDVVTLRKQVDENWFHGELGSKHGFFPATYVQVITALPQEIPQCKALYDFVISDKNEKDCLTFQKDEVVSVIRRIDNNWAEGKLGERIGIFPISFVEMNDAAKWLLNTQSNIARNSQSSKFGSNGNAASNNCGPAMNSMPTTNSAPVTASLSPEGLVLPLTSACTNAQKSSLLLSKFLGQKRHSLTSIGGHKLSVAATPTHRHSVELSGSTTVCPSSSALTTSVTEALFAVSPISNSPSKMTTSLTEAPRGSQGSSPVSGPATISVPPIYAALYNYKPVKDDEIELKKGEYYFVTEKCQDGWFKGTCPRSGSVGVFPGNYVQIIKIGSKSVNRTVMGTSGQQHLLQQSNKTSQNPSVSAVKSHHQHTNVNRAHSFPKTSPLTLNAGENHAHNGCTDVTAKVPNAIVPHGRSATNNSTASYSLLSQNWTGAILAQSSKPRTNPATADAAAYVRTNTAALHNHERAGRRSPSHSHSPRSARKAAERAAKHAAAISGLAAVGDAPPVTARTSSQQTASNPVPSSHSVLNTTTTVTPPNRVVGATVDDMPTLGAILQSQPHEHDSKETERKDKDKKDKDRKDRLSIVRRLTKSKKSKSPPPENDGESSSNNHHRTGSLPNEGAVEGATAAVAPPLPSRKSSADSTKQSKSKPFIRERYRCVVPYPPQSDIELELKLGDIVYVHRKRDDCWYKGTLQRTGKTGLFPASFVAKF